MSLVRAVLFDLDDTLFDHRGAVAEAIVAHRSARYGPGDDAAAVRRWHELEEHHYHRYLGGELDFRGQRRARANDFAAEHGERLDDAAADAWWDEYHERYRAGWRLHEDAVRCLDALQVPVGLITNGDLAAQTAKIEAVDLVRRLGVVVTSGELGIRKPDPGIFHEACRRLGVDAAGAAYVGDRLHTDAIGAARAGLRGVWIDRPGAATPEELAAATEAGVGVIRTLDELRAILR